MNLEDDIAAFTIMVANDPRTLNKIVICKPPDNVISESDLISLCPKQNWKNFSKSFSARGWDDCALLE